MEKVKKILLFAIPMSICNFRCHYCYLAQRPIHFEGNHPEPKYTPEQIAKAFTKERVGGAAFMNFCADGETLLTKDIDLYVKALVEQGHYAEVVTNLTVTTVLDKFLAWDKDLLKRLEFKCSFHYLELKKKGLLERFAENVNKVWAAGASANIEITPSDELIPYIDELQEFSMKHFGALPHLTIARNDNTNGIERLTNLNIEEYTKTWAQFDSGFWKFKSEIFGVKQHDFCYAGDWGYYINLLNGTASACYGCGNLGDIVKNPELPLPTKPIGECPLPHCYNGHAFMTLGYIPNKYSATRYGDIRNRVREDGTSWLQPELLSFFNTVLVDSNEEYNKIQKRKIFFDNLGRNTIRKAKSLIRKIIK